MTYRESAIISAYTGILAGPFDALHEYVEEIFGRPVWTHEMGAAGFFDQCRELAKKDFLDMASKVERKVLVESNE